MDSDLQNGEAISYDDSVPYEEQRPTNEPPELASRIGSTKVYLLSDASKSRKRKHVEETDTVDDDVEMDEGLPYRPNAILLSGTPVSNLTTSRLFAYATHFGSEPLALEWIDDQTCIFVFESRDRALSGFQLLRKASDEEEDIEGFITAKPIPQTFWPPEERINQSLGTGHGLKGILKMRWARKEDVKKRGARKQSKFYQKHGPSAGKDHLNGRDGQGFRNKRRRHDDNDDPTLASRLDAELQDFLAEGEAAEEGPPSKMRSDYIASDGRTLLERTDMPDDLITRIALPSARGGGQRQRSRPQRERRRNGGSGGKQGTAERVLKTQQELDDELDAFLNEGATNEGL